MFALLCVHRCGTIIPLWECLSIIDRDIYTICHIIVHTQEKEKKRKTETSETPGHISNVYLQEYLQKLHI